MRKFAIVFLFLGLTAFAAGKKAPAPSPEPSPSPIASFAPEMKCGGEKPFAVLGDDIGPSVDKAFAKRSICMLNEAIASGCVEKKWLAFKFKTLERDPKPALLKTDNEKAWALIMSGAPYKLDLRWYYSRFSKTIGYTYFYRDNLKGNGSETRIWSNTKFINSGAKAESYAGHLANRTYAAHIGHEKTHNANAGGFGHWTTFPGSGPYTFGDIVESCIP